jgi:hypothetical protein
MALDEYFPIYSVVIAAKTAIAAVVSANQVIHFSCFCSDKINLQ